MKMKRLILIVGGLVLLAAVLCVGGSLLSRVRGGMATPTSTPSDDESEVVTVTVRARGEVVPAAWADLSFATSGQVGEWLVREGELVEAGAPLGRLDTTTLELALVEAQATQETAELKLSQAQTDHERQLTGAQLALQTAEARLAQARARYPTLTAAEVRLQAAIEAEQRAQEEYDKALNRSWEPDVVREGYRLALEQAADARQLAQADYDAATAEQRASSQELIVLEDEVQRAQLELERLQAGVDPLLAREVESARLRVTRAQADLDAATLVAPFDGTVVALRLKPQDWAGAGTPALTLADLSTLRIETTDLDEWSAAKIRLGSPATLVFNAFDDKTLTGHVTALDLRGETLPAGDVVYRAVIELDAPDPAIRWGMTVRVSIPIEE